MQIHSVGIDLDKTTFHLVALGAAGKVLVRKKFTQKQLLAFTANKQTSLIGMEACSGAHFLGRALRGQGHDVRLIAAKFVKPFVKSNKNDFIDAEAIAEAVERKNMRFVPIKTDDQLDLQAIHRVRDRLISRRTAVINQLRALLLERGLVFATTPAKLKAAMAGILENAEADLTPLMRNLIDTLWSEWETVEQQIEHLGDELERISAADTGCTRIRKIPGIGPVVATAIVAAIGNGAAFRKGREFAAWHGIVPRQYSTGGKAKLLGISKRGNVYLRKILIHGARAAVPRVKRDQAPFGAWLDALDSRAPKNVVVVAMRVRSLVPKMVFNDRPTLKDRHARNSSWPGEPLSTERPYTFAQTCLSTKLTLAVPRRTIHCGRRGPVNTAAPREADFRFSTRTLRTWDPSASRPTIVTDSLS